MFVAPLGVAYDLITRLSHTTHALFLSMSAHKCSTLQVGLPLCFFCQITDLRQRLAESQKTVLELEAEREQRQRDYDKKLLLAKSKIENVQVRTQRHKP